MAIRYSGDITIRVTLQDDDTFRAVITGPGPYVHGGRLSGPESLGTCTGMRLAPAWSRSIDCPEAFDEMARAALSFLSAGYGDGSPDGGGPEIELNGADFDDSGYVVTRKRPSWARS